MASIYAKMGRYTDALNYYRRSTNIAFVKKDVIDDYLGMAAVFQKNNMLDSSVYYAKKSISEARAGSFFSGVIQASKLLVETYKSQHNRDSTFKYEELMLAANDSLLRQQQIREMQNLSFIDQLHQQEETNIKQQFQYKIRTFILTSALFVLLFGRNYFMAQ
jgi:hypothetical protein